MQDPQNILNIIERLTAERGYPPTLREIGRVLDLDGPVVLYHLRKLQQQGRIRWQPGQARTIQIIR